MKLGIKKTGLRKIGIKSIREGITHGIKNKKQLITGLILACLMMTGTLPQEVYAGSLMKSEPPSDAAGKMAAQAVSEVASGVQKLVSMALEKTNTAEEAGENKAEEKARRYDISLGFAGDICFGDNYIPMQHLKAIGSEDISDGIDPRYIKIMKGMDLMWINNEFVYSLRGAPLPGKAWTFCGDPAHVSYLKDLGVDIVGLANNHTFDFGEESFLDTLSTLEDAGIPYVGAGRTMEQAEAPVYLQARGFKIAYVAASRAEYTIYTPEATDTKPGILWCYDNTRFLESIRTAAANALQGIEYYKGKPILYSLGNFWFDDYDIDTLVAQLRIKGRKASPDDTSLENARIELKLYPGTQTGVYTGLADTPEWKSRILQDLENISINVTIDENGVVHERK